MIIPIMELSICLNYNTLRKIIQFMRRTPNLYIMKDAYSLDIDNYVDLKKLKKMINFKENSIYIVMYHYIRDKRKMTFLNLGH